MSYTPPSVLTPNVDGVCVETTDWNSLATFLMETAGFAVAASQGEGNGIPQSSAPVAPLACVPGTGLQVKIGGSSGTPQWALIQGILAASMSAQSFSVPSNNSGSTRYDAVCVQQAMVQGSTVSRPVEGGGNQNIPYDYSGMQFQYVQGTSNPNGPNAPSGYVVFAVIAVPNGASQINSGNITVEFPTMNPTGPQGPQGPGTTTLTANVAIPNIGASVAMPVAAAAAFPVGCTGLAVDNAGANAMYFLVVSESGNTLEVMNIGAVDGYSNNGTLHSPGQVIFGTPAPYTITTEAISLPTFGTSVDITAYSLDQWGVGAWGICFNANQAFLFQVTSVSGGILGVTCAQKLMGTGGATMNPGAYLKPIPPPVIYYESGSPINGAVIEHSGLATIGAESTSIEVGFAVAFADTTYRITLGPQGNFNAWVSAKTTSGFTMNVSTNLGAQVEWAARGALNL